MLPLDILTPIKLRKSSSVAVSCMKNMIDRPAMKNYPGLLKVDAAFNLFPVKGEVDTPSIVDFNGRRARGISFVSDELNSRLLTPLKGTNPKAFS